MARGILVQTAYSQQQRVCAPGTLDSAGLTRAPKKKHTYSQEISIQKWFSTFPMGIPRKFLHKTHIIFSKLGKLGMSPDRDGR